MIDGRMSRKLAKELSKGVRDCAAIIQVQHKTKEVARGGGKPRAGKWTTRTGEMARSFHIAYNPGDMQAAYGSDLMRALVVERGTTEALGGPIVPRRAQYLTIPTALAPKGLRAGDIAGLFFVTSRAGNKILALRDGAGGILPMFVLRRSVTIPPRPGLQRAERATQARRRARMLKAVKEGTSK